MSKKELKKENVKEVVGGGCIRPPCTKSKRQKQAEERKVS